MYSSFHRLLRTGSKSIIPLVSVAFLNLAQRKTYNATQQNIQPEQKQITVNQNLKRLGQRHEGWDWDRIIQINTPEQLSHKDVLEKTIICYQMTGNIEIDSQVALLSHLFCDKHFGKISERFQFVFLTPNPNSHPEEQIIYMVFGKDGSKFVPIKKYINTTNTVLKFIPNYSPLFNRLLEQVNKYQELSMSNINEHLQHLGCQGRDTYQLVVIPQNDSQTQINRSKRIMERFLKNRQIWNSQIIKSIVTDHQAKTILGLNQEGIQTNKVYLISPNNQNLLNRPAKTFKIMSKTYTIIPSQKIQKQFIFPPIPPKLSPQSYILKFNVDLNQTRPESVTGIYEMMKNESILRQIGGQKIPKLITFSKSDESIQITIEKNNHDSIIHAYEPGCMYEQNDKRELLTKTNLWKYPHQVLDPEKLKEFVSTVLNLQNSALNQKNKEKYQFFKSQPQTQSVRKSSKLIVGQERNDVINRNEDKVIFHYSKSCHSCKRFGGVYEDLVSQTPEVKFYRIDNDFNKSQGLKNYNSTPVFVMYKNGYPALPWYFKMPYFTKNLFSNFVDITKQVKVINASSLKNHISEHIENQELVKATLKEIL